MAELCLQNIPISTNITGRLCRCLMPVVVCNRIQIRVAVIHRWWECARVFRHIITVDLYLLDNLLKVCLIPDFHRTIGWISGMPATTGHNNSNQWTLVKVIGLTVRVTCIWVVTGHPMDIKHLWFMRVANYKRPQCLRVVF